MTKSLIGGLGPTILGVVWTQAFIGTILVGLRAYAASTKSGKWRWDFIWIVLALVTGIAGTGVVSAAVTKGLGNHTKLLSFSQVFEAIRFLWLSVWTGLPPSVFAKFSIIALLLDVQGPNAKKRRYVLWFIGFLVASTSLIQILLSLFQCDPVSRLWLLASKGSCPRKVASGNFSYFQGAVQAAADFTLALWPISIVWNLQASRQVKVAFCLLMAIGILPSIAVILRIRSLPSIASSSDPTHQFGGFILWAATEVWLVIILGSIPPLRPLFLRVFYGIKQVSTGKDSRPTYNTGTGTHQMRSTVHNRTQTDIHNLDGISETESEKRAGSQQGILVVNAYTVEDEERSSYVPKRNKRESTDVEAIRGLMKD